VSERRVEYAAGQPELAQRMLVRFNAINASNRRAAHRILRNADIAECLVPTVVRVLTASDRRG
jgi:hypothetical protein